MFFSKPKTTVKKKDNVIPVRRVSAIVPQPIKEEVDPVEKHSTAMLDTVNSMFDRNSKYVDARDIERKISLFRDNNTGFEATVFTDDVSCPEAYTTLLLSFTDPNGIANCTVYNSHDPESKTLSLAAGDFDSLGVTMKNSDFLGFADTLGDIAADNRYNINKFINPMSVTKFSIAEE